MQCPLCQSENVKLKSHFVSCIKKQKAADFALLDSKCVGLKVDGEKFYWLSEKRFWCCRNTDGRFHERDCYVWNEEVEFGSWRHSGSIGSVKDVNGEFLFKKRSYWSSYHDEEPEEKMIRLEGNPEFDEDFVKTVMGEANNYSGQSYRGWKRNSQNVRYVSILIDEKWYVGDIIFDSLKEAQYGRSYFGYFYVHPYGTPESTPLIIKVGAGSTDIQLFINEEASESYAKWRESWSLETMSCLDMIDYEKCEGKFERIRYLAPTYGNGDYDRITRRLLGEKIHERCFLADDAKTIIEMKLDPKVHLKPLSKTCSDLEVGVFIRIHSDVSGFVVIQDEYRAQILKIGELGKKRGVLIWVMKDEIDASRVGSEPPFWQLRAALTFDVRPERGMVLTQVTSTAVKFVKVTIVERRRSWVQVWKGEKWESRSKAIAAGQLSYCIHPPSLGKQFLKMDGREYFQILAKILTFRGMLEASVDTMSFLDKNPEIIFLLPFFRTDKEERPLIYDILEYGSMEVVRKILMRDHAEEDKEAFLDTPRDQEYGWSLEIALACFDFDFFIDFIKMLNPAKLTQTSYWKNIRDSQGNTLLHFAVVWDDTKLMKFLVRKRSLLQLFNHEGKTALTVAVEQGNIPMCRQLIRQGASLTEKPGPHFDPPIVSAFQGIENSKMVDFVWRYVDEIPAGHVDCEGTIWKDMIQVRKKSVWALGEISPNDLNYDESPFQKLAREHGLW